MHYNIVTLCFHDFIGKARERNIFRNLFCQNILGLEDVTKFCFHRRSDIAYGPTQVKARAGTQALHQVSTFMLPA